MICIIAIITRHEAGWTGCSAGGQTTNGQIFHFWQKCAFLIAKNETLDAETKKNRDHFFMPTSPQNGGIHRTGCSAGGQTTAVLMVKSC